MIALVFLLFGVHSKAERNRNVSLRVIGGTRGNLEGREIQWKMVVLFLVVNSVGFHNLVIGWHYLTGALRWHDVKI